MVFASISCNVEWFPVNDSYYFAAIGAQWTLNDTDIEGSTLKITDGKESSNAEHISDSLWIAEISWAYVTYYPSKKVLILSTESNESGAERSCTVSAYSGSNLNRYHMIQRK